MNLAIIQGRIGSEPEKITFKDGGAIGKFTVATNAGYFDQQNNWVDAADWHNVVIKGKAAENVEERLNKGDLVLIKDGQIKQRKYESNGETKYLTEIVAYRFEVILRKKTEEAQDAPNVYEPEAKAEPAKEAANEDDLPF